MSQALNPEANPQRLKQLLEPESPESPGEDLSIPSSEALPGEEASETGDQDRNSDTLLSFGSHNGDFSDTADALEREGKDVERLDPSDLEIDEEGEVYVDGVQAEELDAGFANLRPKPFFTDLEEEYENLDDEERQSYGSVEDYRREKWEILRRLEEEYDVEFLMGVREKKMLESKSSTKRFYRRSGAEVTESYSLEEAYQRLEQGEEVIAKPEDRNQGDGVEKLEDSDELFNYLEDEGFEIEREDFEDSEAAEYIRQIDREVGREFEFEEFLDLTDPEMTEKRMYLVGENVFVAEKEHPDIESGWRPQNSHAGGEYVSEVDPTELSKSEMDIYRAGVQLGGIHAIDYVERPDGTAVVLEDNGAPGHGTSEPLDTDISDVEAGYISDRMYDQDTPIPESIGDLTGSYDRLRN